MAIPDYQSVMLPLLRVASDGKEHTKSEAVESIAVELNLTDEERKELLPSGRQATFDNRVGWANTYLKKAGLLEKHWTWKVLHHATGPGCAQKSRRRSQY
jgi:restriction system protein